MNLKFLWFILFSIYGWRSLALSQESVPGEFVVLLNKESTSNPLEMSLLEKKYSFKLKRIISGSDIAIIKTNKLFKINSNHFKSFTSELLNTQEFLVIEPNYIYSINKAPNDPKFGKLWGLTNTGLNNPKKEGVIGVDISAEKAWDINIGGRKPIIGIIDSGINYNHEDLKDNIWTNEAELNGQMGIDDDNNGYIDDIYGYDFFNKDADPMDDNGHGTHCAGVIGAKGDNGVGIVGVVWNTQIMALKFFSKDGKGTLEGALESIQYAVKMGVKVINNSWGGGSYSEILESTIKAANEKGVTFIAAGGNNSSNNDYEPVYPASFQLPNLISVAAIDYQGLLASFSNFGKTSVHLAAPGVSILSTYLDNEDPTSNSTYKRLSGTSMAAPHVAGIVALLFSNEPYLSPSEIKARLIQTSIPMKELRYISQSKGMVNAFNALAGLEPEPDSDATETWPLTRDLSISSIHPYKPKMFQTWEIEVPGATRMGLYFEKFHTEEIRDTVTLTNRTGEVLAEFSGRLDDYWTRSYPGDYIKVTFKTDINFNKYGFDLKKVAYRFD